MDFRRNGLRDERRRRVLIDETLHGGDAAHASIGKAASDADAERVPVKSYSDAAKACSQTPVTFFLPKRPLVTWLVWLIGLAMITGIQSLYHYVYLAASDDFRGSLAALDVTARGSLASWFGAVVLGVSALASLLVYQIRRHRTDDYRGRYRWWLWLVPLLLVLSVNAATGLHAVLSATLTAVTGAEVAVEGKGWWMMAYAGVFFPIVLQLAIELWPSRMATFFFAVTIAAYVVVALFELQIVHLSLPWATTTCPSALLLAAHLGVLATILGYGRYVYLDAHERLAPRGKWVRWPSRRAGQASRPASAPAPQKPAPEDRQLRVDTQHSRFGQQADRPPAVTLQPAAHDPEGEDPPDDADCRLSKAERRRLRKESQRLQRG